ncbi:MAG: phage baseplate protein [Pyrinomonadaceae bacterium]|nr:phage baseplate protein [Pyrinomonadaceae bacterium]
MSVLTAADVVRIWELGHGRSPVEQAVGVLSAAFPLRTADELRRLSLGQRNAHLLAVRESLFGSELEAYSECDNCGKPLEFSLSTAVLRGDLPVGDSDAEFDLAAEGFAVRFRPLNSLDLVAASSCETVEAGRQLLVKRCVLGAQREHETVAVEELPAAVVEVLASRLSECDPQAEILIDLACPVCDFRWGVPFDIATFLGAEIRVLAQRLLREVHVLARAYAWKECDILALSAQRRRYYMEMLGE